MRAGETSIFQRVCAVAVADPPSDQKLLLDLVSSCDRLLPNEIADFLRANGIKGKKNSEASCPIANWLKKETGQSEVKVCGNNIPLGGDCKLFLGNSAAEFVRRFDAGEYPDLVEQE